MTFPAILGGSLIASWLMLRAGIGAFPIVLIVPPIAGALIIGLEWVIPFRREWLRDHDDFKADCLHIVLSAWAVESLPAVAHSVLIAGAASLAGAVGRAPWPIEWPIAAQVALALALSELAQYAIHRSMHTFGPLWKLHAVHHSSRRMYWLNATRVHPLEGLFHAATGATVLVVLGVPAGVLAIHAVFLGVCRLFQHSNLDLRLGPLNWIFSGPEVHRWHHSTNRVEVDANYGTVHLLWDWIFRTRRATPAQSCPEAIGGPKLPTGWWGQVMSPFRRLPEAPRLASADSAATDSVRAAPP